MTDLHNILDKAILALGVIVILAVAIIFIVAIVLAVVAAYEWLRRVRAQREANLFPEFPEGTNDDQADALAQSIVAFDFKVDHAYRSTGHNSRRSAA